MRSQADRRHAESSVENRSSRCVFESNISETCSGENRRTPHAPTSKTLRVNFACAVFRRKVDKGKIGELLSPKSLVVVLTPHGTLPA
jgi:hypothetical protein